MLPYLDMITAIHLALLVMGWSNPTELLLVWASHAIWVYPTSIWLVLAGLTMRSFRGALTDSLPWQPQSLRNRLLCENCEIQIALTDQSQSTDQQWIEPKSVETYGTIVLQSSNVPHNETEIDPIWLRKTRISGSRRRMHLTIWFFLRYCTLLVVCFVAGFCFTMLCNWQTVAPSSANFFLLEAAIGGVFPYFPSGLSFYLRELMVTFGMLSLPIWFYP